MLMVALRVALIAGMIWIAISALWTVSGHMYAEYQCPNGNDCADATTAMYVGLTSGAYAFLTLLVVVLVRWLVSRRGMAR